jgi:4-amino-4-deoxy-L-arabinose transferase-like glycosyltransferase
VATFDWLTNMGKHVKTPRKKRSLAKEYYPLIAILVGVALVAASIAPFHNTDTDLEYDTAQATIQWGMPYSPSYGYFLNQPPVGFYTEAAFFQLFGSTYNNGVALVTAFALATTLLVYLLGQFWYSKRTGLLAAALFGFTPWQFVLARSFLIDVQCLLLSLLFLLVGLWAIRKGSIKLMFISGLIFAAALLTKFYAVYALIPLAVFFYYSRPKVVKENLRWISVFVLPVVLCFFLWYQVISGQGILTAFGHADFEFYNSTTTTPFFVGNFLVDAVGVLFLVSAILSLILCFAFRGRFAKIAVFELGCLLTLVAAASIETFLGAVANLASPYMNPIKYMYQTLPYLALLAASLIPKSVSLLKSAKLHKPKLAYLLLASAALLVAMSLYRNIDYTHQISLWDYLLFRTQPASTLGYSFFHPGVIAIDSPLMVVQYVGFGFAVSGLLWAGRTEIAFLLTHFKRKSLTEKNSV